MDIGAIFNHETTFALHIKHPVKEEPLGIVFKIRSAGSAEVKKIIRRQIDDRAERSQRGKLVKGDTLIQNEVEKTAASICSWDWGGNTYRGAVPEFSFAKAVEILGAEDWIYAQVSEAANNLANFTTDSASA